MIQEPSIMMQISCTVTPHLAKILLKTTSCIELGSPPLYHHCGLDNVSKNNIIHRTSGEDSVDHLWAGCEKSHTGRLQSYSNYKNIYFLDNAEGLECGRRRDRIYDDAPSLYNNLYWSEQVGDSTQAMLSDKMTWDEWVLAGNDSISIWAEP